MTSTLPKKKVWVTALREKTRPYHGLVRNLAAGAGTVLDIYPEPDTNSPLHLRAEDAKRRVRVILRDIEAAKRRGPRFVRTKRIMGRVRAERNLLSELKKNEEGMQKTVRHEACNVLCRVSPQVRDELMPLVKRLDCNVR